MSTYYLLDTDNVNTNTILRFLHNQYKAKKGNFVPLFTDDKSGILLQKKSSFQINTLIEQSAIGQGDLAWAKEQFALPAEFTQQEEGSIQPEYETLREYLEEHIEWDTFKEDIREYMATGAATVHFGVYPGNTDTATVITGQTAFAVGSTANAWIMARQTIDHTADEHKVEDITITTGDYVPGVGFTIFATSKTRLYGRFSVNWSWR